MGGSKLFTAIHNLRKVGVLPLDSLIGFAIYIVTHSLLCQIDASSKLFEHTVITKSLDADAMRKLSHPGMPAGTSPKPGRTFTRIYESADGNPGRPIRVSDLLASNAARTAWLALCSGPCLREGHSQLYPPNDLWKEVVRGSQFNLKSSLYPDPLSLPENILLYADEHQPLFQYGANLVTNVGDWTVPLSFHLLQYCPTGTKGWMLDFLAKGKVTSVKQVATFPKLTDEMKP